MHIFKRKRPDTTVTNEYVTRQEMEESFARHMLATDQRLECVHTIVVDTRQQLKALTDTVKEYTSALLHHIECIDIAVRSLGHRVADLEVTDKELSARISALESKVGT